MNMIKPIKALQYWAMIIVQVAAVKELQSDPCFQYLIVNRQSFQYMKANYVPAIT